MRFNRKSSHKLPRRKSSNVDLLYSLTAYRFVTWIQIGIPALYKKVNCMRFFSCFLVMLKQPDAKNANLSALQADFTHADFHLLLDNFKIFHFD